MKNNKRGDTMKNWKGLTFIVYALLTLLVCAAPVFSAVPDTINFQGILADDNGDPVADGSYVMHFYLFDAATGGSQLWNSPDGEQQTVTVTNGVYNVQLGVNQPLDSTVFDDGAVWLEVVVEGETLSPRQHITAAPFALKAGDADTLTGNSLTDLDGRYVQQGQTGAVDSNMITDGSVTSDDLGVDSVNASEIAAGAVRSSEVANNSLTAADLAADSVTASEIAAGAVGSSEIADGSIIAADLADGATLAEILDDDGPGSGLNADLLDGQHASAFASSSHNHDLDYLNESGDSMSVSTAGTGITVSNTGSGYGIEGRAAGDSGRGLYGRATATGDVTNYGVYATSAGNSGVALYGWATASGDVRNYGVHGYASGDDGRGVYGFAAGDHGSGVRGETSGSYGIAVQGYASENGNVSNYGGHFQALGEDGRGVYGYASNSADGAYNYGGYFRANGSNGRGVYGYASGADGVGVYGYGINGLAGRFVGDVEITGETTTDRVVYNTPRTRYYSVGGTDFRHSNSYRDYVGGDAIGAAYVDSDYGGTLVASVHLPHGAVVTGFTVYFYDNTTGDLTMRLMRINLSAHNYSELARIQSSGTPGHSSATDTTISFATIDNSVGAYHVSVYSADWDGINLAIIGAVVRYTVAEAE
jgi:hypothetical protein